MKSRISLTDEQLDTMMNKYDKNKDGHIDVKEFIDGFYHSI